MHNTALEGSTGMSEIKTEKKNLYLRFSDWMDGALWRRALVLLALSAAVITVFSVYTTPISPYYGNDSAFFLLMGKGVTQGKIPYLDLYDQKGPMIFYVNALGYLLTGDRYGIFLMQIVNLTAACLIVYRLARFWLRSGASLAVVAAYLFVYVGTVQDGNMTEEWSQLFLLLPMYLSLRFLKSGASVSEHPKWYSFVYGVCFGVLLMFRVTNAAPVGGLILAYIILFCREKKVGQLFLHAAIVLWVGAFDLFIYASITHNFFYATGGATARDAVGWLSIIGSVLFVPCFFAAYWPLTRCGTLDGRTYTLIGCYAAVGAVTMAFGFTYRHYFLNLAPAVVVIFAVGIDWVQRVGLRCARAGLSLCQYHPLLPVLCHPAMDGGFRPADRARDRRNAGDRSARLGLHLSGRYRNGREASLARLYGRAAFGVSDLPQSCIKTVRRCFSGIGGRFFVCGRAALYSFFSSSRKRYTRVSYGCVTKPLFSI